MNLKTLRLMAALCTMVMLAGCWEKDEAEPAASTETETVTPASSSPPPNTKPTINGSPPTVIRQDEAYDFRPKATDPDGDTLTFSVANQPDWAQFDPATGRLWGIPHAGDVGAYADIRISVTDGAASAQLSPYTLKVEQIALGSATLSWNAPTQNADGSALTNLAGYKVYYGRSAEALTEIVDVNTTGLTSLVIENLSPATWYFAMTAVNADGLESDKSDVVSKTVG